MTAPSSTIPSPAPVARRSFIELERESVRLGIAAQFTVRAVQTDRGFVRCELVYTPSKGDVAVIPVPSFALRLIARAADRVAARLGVRP